MADITRKTKRSPSDLADEEWDVIAPVMPKLGRRLAYMTHPFRALADGLRLVSRTGPVVPVPDHPRRGACARPQTAGREASPASKDRGYEAGRKVVGRKRWPWMKHLFADGPYDRLKLMDKAASLDFVVGIIG